MKISPHFRLRIGRNDCRNIINIIVHRRITRMAVSTETEYTAKTKHYHEIGFRYRCFRP